MIIDPASPIIPPYRQHAEAFGVAQEEETSPRKRRILEGTGSLKFEIGDPFNEPGTFWFSTTCLRSNLKLETHLRNQVHSGFPQ
jgi:hypothetical protein